MKVLVSIIVPVYNVQKYLKECVDSLLAQTLSDIEIILIDDGSNDGSEKICDEYATITDRIKVCHQKNCGQSVARNVGVSMARGEFILFVDSDDYIIPETCEVLYNTAKTYGAEIVVGDILNEKDKINNDEKFRYMPCQNKVVDNTQYISECLVYGTYDIVPWIRLVERQYLLNNKIDFLEGYFYEDQEYTMRLFLENRCKVIKIRFPFYYYRMDRVGSTTNHPNIKKGYDFVRVLQKMITNRMSINSIRNQGYACSIIGIAYYHFCMLWLMMTRDAQKEMLCYLRKSKFYKQNHKEYYKTLQGKKKIRVWLFLKMPITLMYIEKIKNKVRKC